MLLIFPVFASEAPSKTHEEKMREIEQSLIATSRSRVYVGAEIRHLEAELAKKKEELKELKTKEKKYIQQLRKLQKEKES